MVVTKTNKTKEKDMKLLILITLMVSGCTTINFYRVSEDAVCMRNDELKEIEKYESPTNEKPLFWKESPRTADSEEICSNLISDSRCF